MHCLVCPADCLFAVKALFGLSSPQRAQTTKSKSVELSSGLRPKSITQSTRPYRDLSNWGDELNAWYWYSTDPTLLVPSASCALFCDWPYKIWTNQIPRNLFIPVCTKPSLFGKT
ncbi:Uncharacterized protein HZ326_30421 [Fusarium oxysporum f. sp. albedinis]|nr:Uncharacterized protein HZ326_30421 [Fusarium oxysporum f. sp. albedinis]